jgi:very-short-patch-repair endonuclease
VSSEFVVELAFEWYWRQHRDLHALQCAVDRLHRPGQHGTKVIQELLVAARLHGRPTESALEVKLEAIIGDLDGIVRQYEVFDESGRFVARPDFAIPSMRIAIEAHSVQHHFGSGAARRDGARHDKLVANEWRVRYVTSKEMDDPMKLRSSIRQLLRSSESPTLPTWT